MQEEYLLHMAVKKRLPKLTKILLGEKDETRTKKKRDFSPLHYEVINKALSAKRKDPNGVNEKGYRPLHYAVLNYRPAVFDLLIKAGADPKARGPYGYTSLHILANSPSINARDNRALLRFFMFKCPEMIEDKENDDGLSPKEMGLSSPAFRTKRDFRK